jgi:hypothetical protein
MNTLEKTQQEKKQLEQLVLVIILLLVFIMASRTPIDTDVWWHLRAGEETLRTGQPVLVDTFSYTRYGAAWANHSWLAQVVLALLFQSGGYLALSLLVSAAAVGSLVLVYWQMEGPGLLRAFVIALAGVVSSMVWSPRPQIFSLLGVGVVGLVLYRYKWQGRGGLWLLPLVFIFWSNLHGGYPLGLALIGAMAAGEGINRLLGREGAEILSWRRILYLVVFGALSLLAVVVNPNGLQTWREPFQTVGVSALQKFISEWASPDFHDLTQQSFIWLLFLLGISLAGSRKMLDASDALSVAGLAYLSLVARRNFGPFALAAAPVLARHAWPALQNLWNSLSQQAWFNKLGQYMGVKDANKTKVPDGLRRAINLSLVLLLGLVAILKVYIVSHPAFVDSQQPAFFPVSAVAYLKNKKPEGRLLSEYNWGGYLQYYLRDYPVFVDGRTDLYGDEVINQWMQVVQADAGWQTILDKWDVHLLLLQPGQPLSRFLPLMGGWHELYRDDQAVLFQKD